MYAPDQIPVQERTKMQYDTRPPDGERTEPKISGGSPNPKCERTVGQAATGTSPSEEINISPVPLFLVPQAVAGVIRRHGRAVREIHVRRTRSHQYTIDVEQGRP
jgi:hypothetical protein